MPEVTRAKGRNKGTYVDLDAYVQTVQRITNHSVARAVFLLGDKETGILRDVGEYLMQEREIPVSERYPSDRFRLDLFNVTIDKLTDCESFGEEKPHTDLKPAEVTALNNAQRYVGWLEKTHYPRE